MSYGNEIHDVMWPREILLGGIWSMVEVEVGKKDGVGSSSLAYIGSWLVSGMVQIFCGTCSS